MYRSNIVKGDPVLHSVDFNTLKKNNPSSVFLYEDNYLTITNHSNSAILILGAFSLLNSQNQNSDLQFTSFPFESLPKVYHQFAHEKTFTEIFSIMKKRTKNIESIVEMMNNYPILVCVLECWTRKKGIDWIQSNRIDTMGNEQELLSDLSIQIRGPLLGIIASSLKMSVKLQFEIVQGVNTQENSQEIGEISGKLQVQIAFKPKSIAKGKADQKQGEALSLSKSNECGFLRRSKVAQNQVEARTGPQFKSIKKERGGGVCQKCGLITKRCECNQLKRKGFGFGVTPKNGQMSISAMSKSEPFSIGFLNQHNISKIRDTNNGQK